MLNTNLNPILKDKISRYSLVIAVSKRARQIADRVAKESAKEAGKQGFRDFMPASKPMTEALGTTKPVTYALNELVCGKLTIVDGTLDSND